MSEYNFNFGGMTNGAFKMPNVPGSSRTRATHYNSTQSTFNPTITNENFDKSTPPDLKMIEERLDILKLMCQPEEMQKIEADLRRHLAEANRLLGDICCQKFSERLLGSNTQTFPTGISCTHSINVRNVSRTRTTADNHFGLLNPPISASGCVTSTRRAMNSHQGFIDTTVESVRSQVSRKPSSQVKNKSKEMPEQPVFIAPPVRNREPKKLATSKKRKTEETSEPRISAAPPRKVSRANDASSSTQRKSSRANEPSSSVQRKPSRVNESSSSTVKKPLNALKSKKSEVLPSDDDDDIMCILKKQASKVVKKRKNETVDEPSKPQEEISAVSSRLDDDTSSEAETIATRVSKPRQAKAVTNLAKNSDPSPDTTCNDVTPHPPPKKTRNESQAVRKTKKKDENGCSDAARRKKASKSNNVNAKIANTKKDETVAETNGKSGFEELDERSFFSNISSIGGDSLQIEDCNPNRKSNRIGNHRQYDLPSGFLSPLNARSTSGLSAVSTPLSKTAVKNALDKRLKKPNVAAELKDQLNKKRRKPRITNNVPVNNAANSASDSESESDLASDLSDSR